MIVTPIVWELHDWPADFYRLNPDFYKKLMGIHNLTEVEGSFVMSVRNTNTMYDQVEQIPMIIPHIYGKKSIRGKLLNQLAKYVPELRQCWPHTYLNVTQVASRARFIMTSVL